MMDGGWGGGMGAGAWTLMIIFWIALIAVIGLAIARLFPATRGDVTTSERVAAPSPGQVLDERLARGEIDVETYERLRDVLARRGEGG